MKLVVNLDFKKIVSIILLILGFAAFAYGVFRISMAFNISKEFEKMGNMMEFSDNESILSNMKEEGILLLVAGVVLVGASFVLDNRKKYFQRKN